MPSLHDRETIHHLAGELAELAALPVQEEGRRRWRDLNGLRPQRPMVMIDQVCWNEMEVDDELTLRCEDPECRAYERRLRRQLHQWRHFRVDMVIEPWIDVPMAVHSTGFGIDVEEDTVATDPQNAVVSHGYRNQFLTEADLDRIQVPVLTHDAAESERRMALAQELFRGTLQPRLEGVAPYLSVWDPLSTWMSVEEALYALIDRPDYMHELVRRMVRGHLAYLDQLEAQGLLCGPQSLIHCTGAALMIIRHLFPQSGQLAGASRGCVLGSARQITACPCFSTWEQSPMPTAPGLCAEARLGRQRRTPGTARGSSCAGTPAANGS